MTNFIQPIDAGLGRSVRIKIGHALDVWLMDAENLEMWESKMSASERRFVTTKFIGTANEGCHVGRQYFNEKEGF